MSYQTVEASLRALVRDRIETPTAVPVAYPNAKFDPPRSTSNRSLPWMRMAVIYLDRDDIYAQGRRTITGRLVVSVFVPVDSGTARLLELSQSIVDAVEEGDAGSVQFFSPALQRVELSSNEAAGWLQANVSVNFFADEA